MWDQTPATRVLSLSIWRNLFEDIYILEDPVAAKRASVLSVQCIEVITSEDDLKDTYKSRVNALVKLRGSSEGWLSKWSMLLSECLKIMSSGEQPGSTNFEESQLFAIKVLETLKTCLYWMLPKTIRTSNLLEFISVSLTLDDIRVKTLAADCLHVLFTRVFTDEEDFQAIVGAVFLPAGIATLQRVYDSVKLDIETFDEKSYIFRKKLVEMIVGLGEYLNVSKTQQPQLQMAHVDLDGYLRLVLATTNHPSLLISGLSLQFWCSVLRIEKLASKPEVNKLLLDLLQLAADRCLKYEDVSEDDISRQFLELDFDSPPETHMFLGNYRRFIEDILRLVVCRIPESAMAYLQQRMSAFFTSEVGWVSLNSAKLEYNGNPAYYLAFSQFLLVESALRGIGRWKIWYQFPDRDIVAAGLSETIKNWGRELTAMTIRDPLLLRKLVQSLVQFAPLLKDDLPIMLLVLEKVLSACTCDYPENATDEDRELIRDLRTSCATELNRLAYMIPGALMKIYDELERVIRDIITSNKLSDHETVSFKSFLLVVSQRANVPNKEERFSAIVDPILQSWSDEATIKGLMDLQWFMERVGIVKIAEYFRSRGVNANTDLLSTEMDEAGKKLKAELKDKWSALFPIRATRIFIQYTIEKLDHQSPEYQYLLKLWKPRIQPILPHILQLIAQIEAYHNPNNWVDLPAEVQAFVKYSCTERFWQVGVSTQTRDEFVDESVKAMHTLRDFADSVGHIIRYTREYAFLTLGSISQLEETLYEVPGIAKSLWQALAGDSAGITSHSWRHMISLVLRNLIKNCPVKLIKPFMVEFLPMVLTKLDEVLVEKWEKTYQRGLQLTGGEAEDDLSEEMMEEHLLRQLTAIVVRMMIDLAGQLGARPASGEGEVDENSKQSVLHATVLQNKEILAPFLTLCSHMMLFRDNRCSFNCCLIVRNILPQILGKDGEVDMFLCEVMMKTCLEILSNKHLDDVHSEAGYIITTIYTILRGHSQQPFQTLSSLLPEVSAESLMAFEMRLAAAKSLRQQRGVFLEFLSLVKAMENSDQGDLSSREAQRAKAEKKRVDSSKIHALTKKNTTGGDLMDAEGLDAASIANLFGDE
ncbi:Msn5p [Sugiyamaella lignohabitans]|uniref:Msn5p n=1 Tax=Sugiyamaella lignohabitans TaxID=796027 RepID=A0A167CXD3_9ASCO|nr:Msn5p [Sugiyamaella lignohabitans]ANB12222.1 Msn5p [Sugiyamaella lignohabitans]